MSAQKLDIKAPTLPRRLACLLYETMLLFGVVFIAGYLFSTLTQTRHGLENRHAMQGFLFVVFGIYFTWFWSKGQTLAMKTWRIGIVGPDGEHAPSQARSMLRYLLAWVWFLPPLAAAQWLGWTAAETMVVGLGWVIVWALLSRFHPQRQYWHDALARTRLHTVP